MPPVRQAPAHNALPGDAPPGTAWRMPRPRRAAGCDSSRSRSAVGTNWTARLDREPRAALGATRAQYFAAAGGLHPAAKAMGALAANHGWLVGAFHDLPS